jgi:hypothetical protein
MEIEIDLDELERVAPLSNGCGPSTTIALIARIRELEAVAASLLQILHQVVSEDELAEDDESYRNARSILEKGAVLP